MKVSRVISAVQLKVCLVREVRPRGIFLPWELQTEKVSHLIQMVQHLRTKGKVSEHVCMCLIQVEKKTPSNASKRNFMLVGLSTWFSMALVCAADTQKRARASVIGVAGKPTTTTPIFLSSISRAKALVINEKQKQSSLRSLTFLTFSPESAVTPQATSEWRSICRSASSH